MRLHHLSVTAFGPFADTVEIDFDEVGSAGLFLIHGATGSGKTSLLDAICFALFADVPGARTRKGLSSHHVPEGTQPVVRLEFSAAGRRFRIERSPEFERPKTRGTGLRRMPAAVALEERAGGAWSGVSTRHDEVADVVKDVLNLGLQQFAKVVVLPQGEVAAFLRSSPEDRRALLERLFDISTFTDVEAWLAEERRRTAAEVDTAVGHIDRDLDRLDALLTDSDEPSWRSFPLDEVPARLEAAWTGEQTTVGALLARADEAELACAEASSALAQARAVSAARERGLQAQQVVTAAQEQAEEITALRDTVRRARDADAVAGHLAGLEAAEREEAQARQTALEQGAGPVLDEAARADAAASLTRLRAADPLIDSLVLALAEADRASSALGRARAAAEAAAEAVPLARERAAAAREAHAAGAAHRQELEAVAAGLDAAEQRAIAAQHRLTIAGHVAELCAGRDAAAPELIAANHSLLQAQESLVALRARQLDGMAGALAATLTDGEPCPVCGSAEHPHVASSADLVSAEDLAEAESHHERAQSVVAELRAQESALRARIETLCEQLGADPDALDLDLLHSDVETATGVLRTAEDAARLLTDATTAEAAAAAELSAAVQAETTAAVTLETTTAALQHALDEVVAQERLLDDLVTEHTRECGCVEPLDADDPSSTETGESGESGESGDAGEPLALARSLGTAVVTGHQDAADRAERLRAALDLHAAAVLRRTERSATTLAAAAERGFDSVAEVRDALLPEQELTALRTQVSEHEHALAVAVATLGEEAVAAALQADPPDVAAAVSAEAAARRLVRETQSAHTAAESRLGQLDSLRSTLTTGIASVAEVRTRAAVVKDLADAVGGTGGGNELRMRLSSFVLAARLEKVVALANERLHTMDSGRYLLEHSDARVAGGGRGGLDLRVLDQWTGRTRETASLSGGESFMVSLALALGLADAVREESGGFDLGTLFVDEGFGSLDEDALEHVIGVLDGLREGGRAVGVVSHVPELRTRITHQVVVDKTTSGSTVRVRTTSAPAA